MERGARSALRRPLPARCSPGRPPSSAMPRKCARCGSRVDHRATAQRPVGLAGSASELPSTTSEDGSRPTKGWRTWAPSSRAMEKLSTLHVLRVTSPSLPRGTDRWDRQHAGATDLNSSRTHTRRHHARSRLQDCITHEVNTLVTIGARHTTENKHAQNVDTLKCAFYGAIGGTVISTGRWEAGSCHQTITIRCGPSRRLSFRVHHHRNTSGTPGGPAPHTGPLPGDWATASDDDRHEQASGPRMPQARASTARRLRVRAGKSAVEPSSARTDHRRYRRWLRLTPRPRG